MTDLFSDDKAKRLMVEIFMNRSLMRGDMDRVTGAWCRLLKLEDGRVEYDNEMRGFAHLVLDGMVEDKYAQQVLEGA
jgi:hypothetical protein